MSLKFYQLRYITGLILLFNMWRRRSMVLHSLSWYTATFK